jgi:type IV pilus assembly protein PilC
MPKFSYKARDWSGKLVKGVVDLGTRAEVITSIKNSGLIVLEVELMRKGLAAQLAARTVGRAGLKQITTFTRQLSTMMTAGLALTDALSMLKTQAEGNASMVEITDYALATVRAGQPLGKALEKYQDLFGQAYVASVRAGEEGGVLEEVLTKLADNLEAQQEFVGKVKGAMIYPIIVIVGMIIVAFIMMILVVPKLTGMYADFGSKAQLPASTKALMSISSWTAKLWFLLPAAVFGLFSLVRVADKKAEWRLVKDKIGLKLPIVGELNKKTIIADTTRTLSMLLAAGISLMEAIKIVADVAGNELYHQAFVNISERVQKGFSIADSFAETTIFPPIVNQMIATGEATGKLDEVLIKVSKYFSTEAEQSVKTLTSAIEPVIMIVLGIGVAFLVMAVIMPIYNLTSSF